MTKRLGRGLDALISSLDIDEGDHILQVEIKKIRPNPYQPRKYFEEEALNELADSIKEHGIIQPLIARKSIKGYELVAGERRLRAAKLANVEHVPVVVREFTDEQVMQIALIENLQREDLNAIEIAQAYQKLMTAFSLKQEELAKKVGKSRPHVANFLRLLQLPKEIQERVSRGTLSMGHARTLLGVEKDQIKIELAKEVEEKSLSVRQLEEIVKRMSEKKKVSRETKDTETQRFVKDWEERLRMAFGTLVHVKPSKSKNRGKIEISYFSQEDLERILELVENSKA
ncbi:MULTISPECIES: ParB/RepB/Spo0J family partition protein [Aneurinibacillus]|uniref:Chromosome segregation DNA-binding protein n=1 Tax=Aneurinibacillus thermoaerophilus TaxID=143495 RepID=A0A1G8DDP5_ANETH|nr:MULTISPECIES: ParB/RepB/Spo0J family partition protein [Aneurinibacillus]AMA71464.1 stage 0 sporulation protein J [Aneurinibacillus sp. XH2]MED0675362.1 ParB/RepB/Spo0J family partition protein [Aneurinibacillus thermoaerophilus]MED0679127.1 ParB/RepB/Spo0J family partition protein [Aneurinibacillus thermoaerophilus]MED0738423.1 ParB/RepB/Spo0J family partition protein [Aneurinibacillus thermoaerophilus]MED0757449.1 ParB/RepB/Spo0J family partition protein [Aneurinibacillus thermoaerophilus